MMKEPVSFDLVYCPVPFVIRPVSQRASPLDAPYLMWFREPYDKKQMK